MSRLRILLALLFAACLLAPADAQQFRQPPPYRILVVNDDGVRAPGIAAVYTQLRAVVTRHDDRPGVRGAVCGARSLQHGGVLHRPVASPSRRMYSRTRGASVAAGAKSRYCSSC